MATEQLTVNDLTERDCEIIRDGVFSGDVDEVDILSIFHDPEGWLNGSDSYAARRIRGEEET